MRARGIQGVRRGSRTRDPTWTPPVPRKKPDGPHSFSNMINVQNVSKNCKKIVGFLQSAGWWTSPSYTYTEPFSGARRPRSAHAHALGARTGSADKLGCADRAQRAEISPRTTGSFWTLSCREETSVGGSRCMCIYIYLYIQYIISLVTLKLAFLCTYS